MQLILLTLLPFTVSIRLGSYPGYQNYNYASYPSYDTSYASSAGYAPTTEYPSNPGYNTGYASNPGYNTGYEPTTVYSPNTADYNYAQDFSSHQSKPAKAERPGIRSGILHHVKQVRGKVQKSNDGFWSKVGSRIQLADHRRQHNQYDYRY